MDRYRLIASTVFLFVFLLARYPWRTIVITAVIAIAYLILNNIHPTNLIEQSGRDDRRRMALRAASMFLAPYDNIWGNLKLSNKFCTLRLGSYGRYISAKDTINTSRSFRIVDSKVHSFDDLWNMFCLNFTHNTTFDELIELANRFNAVIEGADLKKNVLQVSDTKQINQLSVNANSNKEEKKELLDVNNASEIELTALPGVSIVMAKKLIKKREEIGGFKSVSDVCFFLKLKPHMQNQLEKLICVKKMKGSIKIERYDERRIDI